MRIIDPTGPEWQSFKRWVKSQIEEDGARLEQMAGIEQTSYLRGRLSAFRSFLALEEGEEPVIAPKSDYSLRK